MGLLKAGLGALGGTLADQWKEFFYCDALDADTMVKKGQKRIGGRSSNTRGSDNIISNGSGIAVADGQCMIIVEQGRVVEVCAEPGEFQYDASTEPSVFAGDLGKALQDTFETLARRITYGGDTGKDQRVYYFNTKELIGNKFGTPNPVLFRVVDRNIGLDIDVSVRCNGVYSYKIVNPLLFYTNVCGNVQEEYTRAELDGQLRPEFISALQPALARLSELELRPNAIPAHTEELAQAMNEALTRKWSELRGLAIVSVAINTVTLSDEDAELIKQAQQAAILRNPTMAAATLAGAQADAMRMAASNAAGAMTGFMGMGMAQQAGGIQAQELYAMGQQTAGPANPPANGWKCSCGTVATGNFCPHCGAARPAEQTWTCPACGTANRDRYCGHCGAPKLQAAAAPRCDKCGFQPADPRQLPRFCPQCGAPFPQGDGR